MLDCAAHSICVCYQATTTLQKRPIQQSRIFPAQYQQLPPRTTKPPNQNSCYVLKRRQTADMSAIARAISRGFCLGGGFLTAPENSNSLPCRLPHNGVLEKPSCCFLTQQQCVAVGHETFSEIRPSSHLVRTRLGGVAPFSTLLLKSSTIPVRVFAYPETLFQHHRFAGDGRHR